MNNTLILTALATLTSLALPSLALAQTAAPATMSMPAKPAMSMPMKSTMSMPGSMNMAGDLKTAPTFRYSTMKGMNMMMTGGAMDISPVTGERLISRSVSGHRATLIYMGGNSLAVFRYYDSAIKAEGWKTTMMDGMMMGGAMKPGAMNAKMGGVHSATFEMGGHTIDLNVRASGGRVTALFTSK